MLEKIEDHIIRPKSYRQRLLRLNEPCDIRGSDRAYKCHALLAYILGTTIPKGRKIQCCHACHNNFCSNPYHLYWGTVTENHQDAYSNGKITIWDAMVRKYGLDKATQMQTNRGKKPWLTKRLNKPNIGKIHSIV